MVKLRAKHQDDSVKRLLSGICLISLLIIVGV